MLIPNRSRAVRFWMPSLMALLAVSPKPLTGSPVTHFNPAHVSRTVQIRHTKDPISHLAAQDSASVYQEYQVDEPATVKWGNKVQYPPVLKSRKLRGTVILQFVVDSAGRIEKGSVHAIRTTDPAFTAAVMAVLPSGRLTPAIRGGKRVRQVVEQAFLFAAPR